MLTGSHDAVAPGAPESLRRLIEQHFEQLDVQDQSLLEAASTVGREFAAASVGAGSHLPLEEVERRCAALVRRGQFIGAYGTEEWPDGTVTARYRFIHDLYREVVYERLPVSQQIRLHRHIGRHLEASYGPQARLIAVELARHFVCSRDLPRAVQYLWYAGEQAVQRSAYQEAMTHLTSGIEMLRLLPATLENLQQEIPMQLMLAVPLIATKGYGAAEVIQWYNQAHILCQEVGESPHLFTVLRGLWNCFLQQGNFRGTLALREFAEQREQCNFEATLGLRALAEQLLRLAQEQGDVAQRIEAHRALGTTLFYMGELVPAQEHF